MRSRQGSEAKKGCAPRSQRLCGKRSSAYRGAEGRKAIRPMQSESPRPRPIRQPTQDYDMSNGINKITTMKKIFSAALAALLLTGCAKERETPEPTPAPTPEEELYDVYVVGTTYDKDWNTETLYYWKNGQRYELTAPYASVSCQGIVVADGSVYIGADGDGSYCGYWKDGVWHANAKPEGAETFWSSPITVSEGSVYTPGSIYNISNDGTPGYWKDGAWNSLPLPERERIGSAYSIAIDGGSVYVAGSVNHGWTKTGYWKDGVWQELERPTGVPKASAGEIACVDGSVYVSGGLSDGRLSSPCYWVNGVLHIIPVPEGVNYSSNGALAVSDGTVYMAGYYYIGNIYKTCYWKDGVFIPLEAPGELGMAPVSIAVSDGTVFVSGTYIVGDDHHACYWKDGERTDLPVPEGVNVEITGIAVVKK